MFNAPFGKAGSFYPAPLIKTDQTTQYSSELDDGYYERGLAKSYTINTTGSQSGTSNVDLTHLISDTGAFTAADKTYTDAGKCGVFKAAGGETVIITGSASNNGTFTTASATANTVVFVQAIVNEADAPMTTFQKRDAISNNTVLDNNTGLTWQRYTTSKFGAAGTGVMPWTGVDYDIFAYCAAANAAALGGQTDWRVPNFTELYTIFKWEQPYPYPDTTAFPSFAPSYVWTSTTLAADTTKAYFHRQNSIGDTGANTKTSSNYSCYLVRGG